MTKKKVFNSIRNSTSILHPIHPSTSHLGPLFHTPTPLPSHHNPRHRKKKKHHNHRHPQHSTYRYPLHKDPVDPLPDNLITPRISRLALHYSTSPHDIRSLVISRIGSDALPSSIKQASFHEERRIEFQHHVPHRQPLRKFLDSAPALQTDQTPPKKKAPLNLVRRRITHTTAPTTTITNPRKPCPTRLPLRLPLSLLL